MGCPAYKDLLSRYIDGELSKREREELQTHLQTCSRCSHALAKYRQMEALLGSKGAKPVPKPNPEVRNRVLAAIEEQQKRNGNPLHRTTHGHATPRFRLSTALGFAVIVVAVAATAVLLIQNPAARGLWGGGVSGAGEPSPTPDLALTSIANANATATAIVQLPPAHITDYGAVNTQSQPLAAVNVPLDAAIAVRFDAPMERASVEQAWRIRPVVPGSFNWVADNEVRFQPYNLGYIPAVTYTLSLSNAHVLGGGQLAQPLTYTWRTIDPPVLVSHSPAVNSIAALTQPLTLSFSQPMHAERVQTALSLSPAAAGTWTWVEGGLQASFTPDGGWQPGSNYTVTLSHNAANAAGVAIGHDTVWQFITPPAPLVSFPTAQRGSLAPLISFSGLGSYSVPFHFTQPDASVQQFDFQLARVTDGNILASEPKLKPLTSFSVAVNGRRDYDGSLTLGLNDGAYLLVAPTGQRVYLLVGSEQLAAKLAGGQLLVWATQGEKPIAGREIQIYDAAGNLLDDGTTAADGLYLTNLTAGAAPSFVLAREKDAARAVAFLDAPPARIADAHIFLYADRPAYMEGDTLNFKAIARVGQPSDYQLPSTDANITMRLRDAAGTTLASVMLRPDSYGAIGGSFPLTNLSAGWYTLTAATMGQEQSSRFYVYTTTPAATPTRTSETGPLTATTTLDVVLDKDSYSVGETATVTINSQFAERRAMLLTAERDGFIAAHSLVISGSATIELPITAAMAPAARLQVALLTADGPISGGVDLRVPLGRTLDVQLEPDPLAAPGGNAVFTVRVADDKGQPLPASLTFSVGNTAPSDDLAAAFYPATVAPAPLYTAAPPAATAANPNPPPTPQLAYWGGNLLVGSSGVATFTVTLPAEARGEWWATARVVADNRFGQASISFPLTMPLEIRPNVAASFVQGDRANVSATLINHSNRAVSGHITLSSDGIVMMNGQAAEQPVDIEPGREQQVTWRVQVRRANAVRLVFDFFADDDSNKGLAAPLDTSIDANAVVLAATPLQVTAAAGIATYTVITTTLGPDPALDLSSMELEFDPSLAAALVGSLEAQLAAAAPDSEAQSAVVAATAQLNDTFARLQYSKSALPFAAIATAMQGAYTNQQPDGGWSAGDGQGSDVWATAFVMHNLARIADAGQPVDAQVTQRAVAWLRGQLPNMEINQQAFSYYVLAEYGAADLGEVRPLMAQRLDQFGQACLILSLQRLGDKAAAHLLAQDLSVTAHRNDDTAAWQSPAVGDTVATAMAVAALMQTLPTDPLIGKGVHYLLNQRVSRRWGTARASAAAFATLATYTRDSNDGRGANAVQVNDDVPAPMVNGKSAVGGYGYKVYLNDALLVDADIDPANPVAGRRLITLSADKLQQQNVIRLAVNGSNPLYYAVTSRYRHSINASFTASDEEARRFSLQNPRAIPSANRDGLSINRSYTNVSRPQANDLRIGDTLRVALKLQTDKDAAPLGQAVVAEQLPAAFNFLSVEQPTRTSRRAAGRQSDDEEASGDNLSQYASFRAAAASLSYTLEDLQPGRTYTFSYLVRVSGSGDFSALPARVYPAQQPDQAASSASNLISVTPDQEQEK